MPKTPRSSANASSACASLVVLLLAMAPARADDPPTRVLVIPLTTSVPDRPELAPALTRALARVAAVGGAEVIEADAPLADAAAVVGCAPDAEGCLDMIASALGVQEILFGDIAANPAGGLTVSLTYHRPGDTRQRSFDVADGPMTEQARAVAREGASLLSGEEPEAKPPEPEPEPAPPPIVEVEPAKPEPAPSPRDERSGLGRVGTTSWIVLGGGVALAGTGAAFLVLANQRQDEVDRAPANTPDDFRDLVALEDEGERYARVGGVLLGVGGAAVAAGVVLLVLDMRSAPERAGGVAITPVPYVGGGGIAVTLELP